MIVRDKNLFLIILIKIYQVNHTIPYLRKFKFHIDPINKIKIQFIVEVNSHLQLSFLN